MLTVRRCPTPYIRPTRPSTWPRVRTRTLSLAHLVAGALLLLPPVARAAAQGTNPVDDLILRVVSDVSDLRFGDALTRGREILAAGTTLRPQQEITLRIAMAAAFFPDFGGDQQPDSALTQFDRVVRIAPDAEIPITLAWDGLDSLLQVARARTFVVVVRPPMDSVAIGGERRAEIEVVATRAARYRLATRRVGGSVTYVHSVWSTPASSAQLALRADDGTHVLLEPGAHDVFVTAVDPVGGDSITVVRRAVVTGTRPSLLTTPVLDSAQLQQEESRPRPFRTALTGLLFGGFAVVVANEARGAEPLRSAFAADNRAGLVGGAILLAAVGAIWMGRDGRDEAAITYNAAVREAHARALAAAESENRRRLAQYRATMVIAGEGR
jgi:hypothetical protein